MSMKYAGIGSRETPEPVLKTMREMARELAEKNYTLRSGGADGADFAFEQGCDLVHGRKEIYLPWRFFNGNKSGLFKPSKEAMALAEKFHPAWYMLSGGAKKLMARNSHQVLGINLDDPVDFIICWTDPKRGGTTQALRIAEAYGIKIFNLKLNAYTLSDMISQRTIL